MAARRKTEPKGSRPRRPPATTPEAREQQLVSLAIDLAEKQLLEGTASAQVVTHFLKHSSTREALEQERLRHEIQLLEMKRQAMQSQQNVEKLYAEAMQAFRSYSGQDSSDEDDEDYDD